MEQIKQLKLPHHPIPKTERLFCHFRSIYGYFDGDVYNNNTGNKLGINISNKTINLYFGTTQRQFPIEWIRNFQSNIESVPRDIYKVNYVLSDGNWMTRSDFSRSKINTTSYNSTSIAKVDNAVKVIVGPTHSGEVFKNARELSISLGLDQSNISKVLRGKKRTIKGYIIEYITN